MPDPLDNSAPFNDKQGTRIAKQPSGAGAEATESTQGEPAADKSEHVSGYGGHGGTPKIHPTKPDEPRRDPRDVGETTARREPPIEPDIPRSRR
jgi:hypothetical protein